jgi:uncharacterized protein
MRVYTIGMHRGIATFTLDYGKCPPWLFERMVKLGREMVRVLVDELGPDEFIRRMSHPTWFQSLGTVLAFDWNASGLTTILTAALKEAIRGEENDLGIFICGGKGKTSLKTPAEIANWGHRLGLSGEAVSNLTYNSKMTAKVDSSLIQDGYQIYHHAFFFSRNGAWTVVQQGMNTDTSRARRYHWHSADIKDLVQEPHVGIVSDSTSRTLNLVADSSGLSREISVELLHQGYFSLMKDVKAVYKHASHLSQTVTLENKQGDLLSLLNMEGREFHSHPVQNERFTKNGYLEKILAKLVDAPPENYEDLLATEGVGPRTMRALSLVGEVIYGAKPSYEDPARYSFAHGGKDATPYPVDRKTYDETISILSRAVRRAKLEGKDRDKILHRLPAP